MITENTVYWIVKLDDIRGILAVFTFCFFVAAGIFFVASLNIEDSTKEKMEASRKKLIPTVIFATLLAVAAALTPSTKEMAMIKVIPTLAKSDIVSEMSTDAKEIYKMGINAIKKSLNKN